jgi:hypothetical protein
VSQLVSNPEADHAGESAATLFQAEHGAIAYFFSDFSMDA